MLKQKPPARLWAPGDFASLLFPQRCPFCDNPLPFRPRIRSPLPEKAEEDSWIHAACYPQKNLVKGALCFRCGKPLGETAEAFCSDCRNKQYHFKRNCAIWRFEEPARSAVTRFKYHGRQQYALYFARAWLGIHGDYLKGEAKPQILIPVPIHKSRLRKRGYNQAALLAYELEKLTGISCREDVVIRTKHTGAQKDLGPAERLKNMENAFRIRHFPEGISRVLIVDDIYTTGSTLESISRLLSEAGIPEIYTATLCVAGGESD